MNKPVGWTGNKERQQSVSLATLKMSEENRFVNDSYQLNLKRKSASATSSFRNVTSFTSAITP